MKAMASLFSGPGRSDGRARAAQAFRDREVNMKAKSVRQSPALFAMASALR